MIAANLMLQLTAYQTGLHTSSHGTHCRVFTAWHCKRCCELFKKACQQSSICYLRKLKGYVDSSACHRKGKGRGDLILKSLASLQLLEAKVGCWGRGDRAAGGGRGDTTHLKASSRACLPLQKEGCRKWGTGEAASSKPSSKAKKAFCRRSLP